MRREGPPLFPRRAASVVEVRAMNEMNGNQIRASDGETRIIGVGEIILIEDVHGKGHLSQAVGQMRRSIMIPID
jgi:hypothetical protein